jgi:hypothetical protein
VYQPPLRRCLSREGVYLVLYFAVGAIGTALAAPLLDTVGWPGATLTALAALLLAATLGHTGTTTKADMSRPQKS